MNTHPEQWADNVAAHFRGTFGGSVPSQGSHLSRGLEGGDKLVIHSPHRQTRTGDLRVTSPTLYPLGHDCHNNNVYESVTEDLCTDLCIIYSIYSCINKEICICNYIVLELQKTNNNFSSLFHSELPVEVILCSVLIDW